MNVFQKSSSEIGWCALKLDMEKAYDRIEWVFLWKCIIALAFHHNGLPGLKNVFSVSYSIKVNRENTPWFRPQKGLRQGDPLSPYLFIMCMYILIQKLSLESATSSSDLGRKLCPNGLGCPVS